MTAIRQTQSMLAWWRETGIDRVDLAVKRSETMIWHRDLALDSLPLLWVKAQNAQQGDVYIRPARGYPWPLVFLDDVAAPVAVPVMREYEVMVVRTSPPGGCHLWLACDRPLGETARCEAQRWLARLIQADPASVSGEHLGRLAGFKNWKRGGTWVNVLATSRHGRRWDPTAAAPVARILSERSPTSDRPDPPRRGRPDGSPSGREWGWVCGLLEAGWSPDVVYSRLVSRARPRRGRDTERYARRTMQRAQERVA